MGLKPTTVQYRYLKDEAYHAGRTLQQTLVKALMTKKADGSGRQSNAKHRIIDLDQDGAVAILNKVSNPATWGGPFIAGQLIQLQEGTDVQTIKQSLNDDTEEFLLQRLDIEQSRIVRGVLYFVANGSHLGIVEGHQLRSKTLERYLTSLFQEAGLLQAGQIVQLPNRLMVGTDKGLTNFKELTITAKKNLQDGEEKVVEKERARSSEKGRTVFDVLKALGWTHDAIARLEQEIPQGGWIEGFFRVAIKSKRRVVKVPREALEEALRNIDVDDLGLRGDGQEKGGFATLSVAKSIHAHGQLLDPKDAFEKIIEAMKEWADQGKIDCKFT